MEHTAWIEVLAYKTSVTFAPYDAARRGVTMETRGATRKRWALRKGVTVARRGSASHAALRDIQALLSPPELARFARHLRQAEHPPAREETARVIAGLTEGKEYSSSERLHLETEALLRTVADRRSLLRDAVTAGQAACILGRSRQTVHDRVKAGTLLAISNGGILRFPPWQFAVDAPRGVVPGLPAVLAALEVSPLAKARWLTRPNATFQGQTPLDALKAGERARVVAEARGVGQV